MMLYSTAMAAPNGIEVAGALLLWSALLGIARTQPGAPDTRFFLVLATIGAVPLAVVRTLGPLWLLLVVATAALLLGRDRIATLARRTDAAAGAAIVLLATAGGAGWSLLARPLAVRTDEQITGSVWSLLPEQWVLWFLQAIAAFPARDEVAPTAVYAITLAAVWALLAVAWRVAAWPVRRVLLAIVVVASAVPIAATIASYEQIGTAWQGRYGYPFAMGFILICGFAADRWAGAPVRLGDWPLRVAAAVTATAGLIAQLDVLANQTRISPLSGDPAWIAPHPAVVVGLTLAGTGLLAWALARPRTALGNLRP
jgi:hypothetical protein